MELLKRLDPKTIISENLRSDMLLDMSGLSKTGQLLIKTFASNSHEFDKVADALKQQHHRIHVNERSSSES